MGEDQSFAVTPNEPDQLAAPGAPVVIVDKSMKSDAGNGQGKKAN